MPDFTLKAYRTLLQSLRVRDFSFQPFAELLKNPANKAIVLRHDVDLNPMNSLAIASIESDLGIAGSYYFRIRPESFDPGIIRAIASLGHEIGYHYEDVSMAANWHRAPGTGLRAQGAGRMLRGSELRSQGSGQNQEGSEQSTIIEESIVSVAIESFADNLEKLRKIVPVSTICMHGSPLSRWDSRLLWKYYDYKDFGIIGEPYFDIDFDEVLYLTDTGRRWDGERVSVRDKAYGSGLRAQGSGRKAESSGPRAQGAGRKAQSTGQRAQGSGQNENPYSEWKVKPFKYRLTKSSTQHLASSTQHPTPRFHSTFDIIKAAHEDTLPLKMMMTFHPQRWTDKSVPWLKELVWQNIKNVGKYFLLKIRD